MPASSHDDPSPTKSERVREIVRNYIDLCQSGESVPLEAICGEHPELIDDVRRRVKILEGMGLLGSTNETKQIPDTLGEYRLKQKIGEGGMGVVYLAEQPSLGRSVALKIIRPEQLHFAQTRDRFWREVEAVARLHHPSVVPIYNVGEEDGVPFFAMEYVEGCSIDTLLRGAITEGLNTATATGKDLHRLILEASAETGGNQNEDSTRKINPDRQDVGYLFADSWWETCLRIVRAVSDALEHAHHQGVIHRDVKPSNIMLTPSGRVLLMDFGLAAAEGTHSLTRTGSWLGSLPYMPPEVLAGGRAEAPSDVYSLGVTLYQMLTLDLPFRGEATERLRQLIVLGEIPSLRRSRPNYSWELETVVFAAMDHDVTRRYKSPGDFGRDLENVLTRRPIEARRAGALLRVKRWAQRNPAWAVSSIAGLLLVVASVAVAVREREQTKRLRFQAEQLLIEKNNLRVATDEAQLQRELAADGERRANLQKDNALQQKNRADQNLRRAMGAVDAFLQSMADDWIADMPHLDGMRRSLLGRALEFYRGFLTDQSDEPEVLRRAAYAHGRLAQVHNMLGDFELSSREFEKSEELWNQIGGPRTRTEEDVRSYVDMLINRAENYRIQGDLEGAIATSEIALDFLIDEEEGRLEPKFLDQIALARNNLATFYEEVNRMDDSILHRELARDQCKHYLREHPENDAIQREYGRALHGIAVPLGFQDRLREAEDSLLLALEVRKKVVSKDPGRGEARRDLGLTYNQISWVRSRGGRIEESVEPARESVRVLSELVKDHPLVPNYSWDLGQSLNNLGNALNGIGEVDESFRILQSASDTQRHLVERYPEVPNYRSELGGTLNNIALHEAQSGDIEKALETIEEAIELQRSSLRDNPSHPVFMEFLSIHFSQQGSFLVDAEDYEGALETVEALLDESTHVAKHSTAANILLRCASSLTETEGDDAAEPYFQRAVEIIAEFLEIHPESREQVWEAQDLEALRARSDFRELLGRD